MAKTIAIVEDEPTIRENYADLFRRQGYRVETYAERASAAVAMRLRLPDLAILDIGLGDEFDGGFELCRELRGLSATLPIIFLTARDSDIDTVAGLRVGADDYVTKPFGARELVSRVKAVLRRTQGLAKPEEAVLRIDDRLSIDLNSREVIVDGKHIKLRPTEFRLLYHLVENAGWVVPHETLLAKVWGYEYREEVHYLRLYVTYLRQKIEPDPSHPRYILTERGVGYRFVDFRKGQGVAARGD